MIDVPEVSVVMGIYNSAASLEATLDSILLQEGVDFEFIVVNDGSTDASGEILDRKASNDPRLKIFHQANAGLTASLKRGCEAAQGRFIARQDAGGDLSLQNRLSIQAKRLREDQSAVFATCGHRLVCEDGTFLCDVRMTEQEIANGLTTLSLPGLRGILHGSSMYRADVYRRVGGYRLEFLVAQDIDLWLRLFEVGRCAVTSELGYDCMHDASGISATRRVQQLAMADLAGRCASARRSGLPEPVLAASHALDNVKPDSPKRQLADYHYFVASCLRRRDPSRARRHFLKAWRCDPARLKALLGAVLTWRDRGIEFGMRQQ